MAAITPSAFVMVFRLHTALTAAGRLLPAAVEAFAQPARDFVLPNLQPTNKTDRGFTGQQHQVAPSALSCQGASAHKRQHTCSSSTASTRSNLLSQPPGSYSRKKQTTPTRLSGLRQFQTAASATVVDSTDGSAGALPGNLFDEELRATLTPAHIVSMLDRYIVGQADAKRAVAIALRNRWRRQKVPPHIRDEIMPKNILMIGPTGCGKTEIARRLAKLADAPFIKVEATKYTELGYVGRDVEDIIKDLVENAINLVKTRVKELMAKKTAERVEQIIVEAMCGQHADPETLETFRNLYREGHLNDMTLELELPSAQEAKTFNFESGVIVIDRMFKSDKQSRKGERKKMKVTEAKQKIEEQEAEKALNSELIAKEAIRAVEQDGMVFIDEIDKIVEPSSRLFTGNVSSEGVQRDLLPIIEGCTVNTKYGPVNTDHILFICAGAFHSSKPSDMLAELQGRLPIRVELKGLTADDFYRILTEPENNMIRQQQLLLETEGVKLEFSEGALRSCAKVSEETNRLLDNIGARRLHTVLERVLGEISYSAPERAAEARKQGADKYDYTVDEQFVMQCMSELLKKQDLSKYVL